MAEARILLVDDDPLVRNAIGEVLERAGYAVETHDSGFGLAQAIREHRPDLVLLDVSMPGLRGDAALRAAQSLSHAMPAVTVALFSGIPADELADRARELGIHSIPKPISPRGLIANVERLLVPTRASA